MKAFWTTWVEGSDGGYGYRHASFESAQKEAERIAIKPDVVGKQVFVMAAIGAATAKQTEWEAVDIDDVPF